MSQAHIKSYRCMPPRTMIISTVAKKSVYVLPLNYTTHVVLHLGFAASHACIHVAKLIGHYV